MTGSAQDQRVKTALDETRLLILGAQILFGFHLNGAFQTAFDQLGPAARQLHALSFLVMAVAVALLVTPSLQHQIVDRGNATRRILVATSRFAGAALLPIAVSLGTDIAVVIGFRFGALAGVIVGAGFGLLALSAWYGAEWFYRRPTEPAMRNETHTPVDVRVEHMLTEARVLLPGAQALLGFQLAVMLTDAFGALSFASKLVHALALGCIALAVILLMAPAAFHRISFGGENTEDFYRLGSALVIAAAVPLAAGIAGDLYVAVTKAFEMPAAGIAAALAAAVILAGLWFVQPLLLRARGATPSGRKR
jgi:uncharacterized protein DUF6328